ncbi:MAG: VPLPA-CTERM sorting domain-containing protein, partial [Gammaproteobacteria bacterium]
VKDKATFTFSGLGDFTEADITGIVFGLGTSPDSTLPAVPVPAAVWLFGSGLLGMVGIARRKKA